MIKALTIISFSLFIMLVVTILILKYSLKEQDELKKKIDEQQANIKYLLKNANDVAQINKESAKVKEAIKNAETEEDINNIVAGIISANNSRV